MNCPLITIRNCGILKYAAIYIYPQQLTITYNRLFIAIHNSRFRSSSAIMDFTKHNLPGGQVGL